MKKSNALLLVFILLASNLLVIRCDLFREKNTICFSGRVVDHKGNPVEGARISIGGQKGKDILTAQKGEFNICTRPDKSQRYVVNIEKLGFGFVSKIYTAATGDILITMEQATVVEELNPNDNITITDIVPNTSSPAQPDYSRMASPLDTIPFVYDASGRLIAFGAPPEVERTYEAIDRFRPQRRGATVRVEPDALEDPTANREQRGTFFQASKSPLGNVTGSVSTVDVYSPDGMPGDYTTRMQNGERGFMITYGAVDVNFYGNGKPLQLKKGKFATISIPVDTLALIYGEKLPPTIPLLVYDKESGLWQRDGNNVGTLNASGTAYEAKISHFSVFNMDEEFAAGVASCYKLCSGTAPAGAVIQITGVIPNHIKNLPLGSSICGTSGTAVGCNAGESAYAINNMKPNEPIGVRLFDGSNVRASYVLIAGGPASLNETNCSNNYNGCLPSVAYLNWTQACYQNVNGTLTAPILAVRKAGTSYDFSWLYIDTASPATSNSTAYHYAIEYKTQPSSDTDFDTTGWNKVDFDPGAPQTYVFPASATTEIRNKIMSVSFSGGSANPVIPATDFLFFRVNYGTDPMNPDGFTKGTIYAINLPVSGLFLNDFESDVSCYTK
jgi:hypothetical protein